MKYLSAEQLKANLSLGKMVEQWLSSQKHDDYSVISWLFIIKEKDLTYSANYVECFDDGDANFIDIYEFSALHPDEPFVSTSFSSIDNALEFAVVNYSASLSRFVNAGVIQDEYVEYLNQR